MKYIKLFESDKWLETSWSNNGSKVTISEVIEYLDKNHIDEKDVDMNKIIPIIINTDYDSKDKERVEKSDLNYPIIVVIKDSKYKSILDGNHRSMKALYNKQKTIKVREIDLDSESTPKIYKDLFNYKIEPLIEGSNNLNTKKSHFFDVDTILVSDNKVWIVDKTNPNNPIMKISKSEFNLIKSGIYKSQNNKIDFSGKSYWLPSDMLDIIKIKCKNNKSNVANLGFSMQEFMNKEIIDNIDYSINIENILHLKNTDDDIYFICSRNNKKNYELMISKIEDKLKENGLKIKKYYFISETFYNRNGDQISHKKVRLLLQHLVGLKTEGDKFTDEELEKYTELYFYDDEEYAIKLAIDSNKLLTFLLSNTDPNLKDRIKSELKEEERLLFVNYVTSNRVNRFITTKVKIEFSNLIKAFESFKWK